MKSRGFNWVSRGCESIWGHKSCSRDVTGLLEQGTVELCLERQAGTQPGDGQSEMIKEDLRVPWDSPSSINHHQSRVSPPFKPPFYSWGNWSPERTHGFFWKKYYILSTLSYCPIIYQLQNSCVCDLVFLIQFIVSTIILNFIFYFSSVPQTYHRPPIC